MRLTYKRGLFRFWVVASAVWLAAVAIMHGEAIGFYAGFHYHLFDRAPSWHAALEEKHRTATQSQSCRQAHNLSCKRRNEAAYAQCIRPDRAAQVKKLSERTKLPIAIVERNFDDLSKKYDLSDNEYETLLREKECSIPVCDRDAYLQNAKALFTAAGHPIDRLTVELCDGFRMIEVPYLNWTAISVVVLPIFLPLILWLIGAWIARGFVGAKGRAEKD